MRLQISVALARARRASGGMTTLGWLLASALLLAGCGQKGPLTLGKPGAAASTPTTDGVAR